MDYKSVEFYDNYLIIKELSNFKLKHIFECGQIFRFEEVAENNFIVIAFGRLIEVKEEGNDVIIYNSTKEDFQNIWLKYFDLDRDYSIIKDELSKDVLLKQSIEFGYGVRVLNQESI
ncbi:3-methyladenine DNA glycosylase/8-oxoguanine DNA glycosylase [Clostridium beijerinckii]|nr:3-methyladenine DNA glycosylase/8-oxoguanine DNA glycosylase [Clostridium beijerinckii]